MKKTVLLIFTFLCLINSALAFDFNGLKNDIRTAKDVYAIKNLLKSQVRYANDNNFEKFIATYDEKYVNGDGFNLDVYSTMVRDLWTLYDGIEYAIEFKKIDVNQQEAQVELVETSYADIDVNDKFEGELKSSANSIYYLRKINGKWRVISDSVIDETTSMLYGAAKDLDVILTVPTQIEAGSDYLATLEFTPPSETFAIASIASDRVEYPQKPTKEVFRLLPEDNILERYFTSNCDNMNEYIVASIGLTKTTIDNMSLNLNLTGFGYAIKRVNVLPKVEKNNDNTEVKVNNVKE